MMTALDLPKRQIEYGSVADPKSDVLEKLAYTPEPRKVYIYNLSSTLVKFKPSLPTIGDQIKRNASHHTGKNGNAEASTSAFSLSVETSVGSVQ